MLLVASDTFQPVMGCPPVISGRSFVICHVLDVEPAAAGVGIGKRQGARLRIGPAAQVHGNVGGHGAVLRAHQIARFGHRLERLVECSGVGIVAVRSDVDSARDAASPACACAARSGLSARCGAAARAGDASRPGRAAGASTASPGAVSARGWHATGLRAAASATGGIATGRTAAPRRLGASCPTGSSASAGG